MDREAHDRGVREAAFAWLRELCRQHGEVLPLSVLATGFTYGRERVAVISQQGIFKPRQLDAALSIMSSVDGPYADAPGPDGLLSYCYREGGPDLAGVPGFS
jgi:putative restriction endonuclease